MTNAIDNLRAALQKGAAMRPLVGGFPHLAETLRRAGVRKNYWTLPSCQSLFVTDLGPAVFPGTSLINGPVEVPAFDQEALIRALRTDQAGQSTFPEFLASSWQAGIVSYEVDFSARTVSYRGCNGEEYVESYPAVEIEE